MATSSLRILTKLHVIALFICVVLRYYPREKYSSNELLTQQCEYDTRELCPDCFPEPNSCDFFKERITFEADEPVDQLICRYNQHSVRYGLLDGKQKVVIKNLNKRQAVEKLRDSICEKLNISQRDCRLNTDLHFLRALVLEVLDENLIEGAIMCPQGDVNALHTFLSLLDGPQLVKLVLMRTNVEPLLLQLPLSRDTSIQPNPLKRLPLPKFIYQAGFTLVESYDGETLTNFYDSPLAVRLIIANELINAVWFFTKGQFKFYLTDINPDNIAVKTLPSGGIEVSFIDLDNIIILNSLSEKIEATNLENVHARIECDGCFAYVQNELCAYRNSDINMFALCQLFLENLNGNRKAGFLHTIDDDLDLTSLHELLHHCVYCNPPNCQPRPRILQQIQQIIQTLPT